MALLAGHKVHLNSNMTDNYNYPDAISTDQDCNELCTESGGPVDSWFTFIIIIPDLLKDRAPSKVIT